MNESVHKKKQSNVQAEAEYIEFIIREMPSSFSMEQKRRITLPRQCARLGKEASCKQGFILATRASNIYIYLQ